MRKSSFLFRVFLSGASIFPTSRNLTDDCVVPSGGLVLHVIWEGGLLWLWDALSCSAALCCHPHRQPGRKTILWAPEESIPLLNEKKRQAAVTTSELVSYSVLSLSLPLFVSHSYSHSLTPRPARTKGRSSLGGRERIAVSELQPKHAVMP